MLTNTEVAQAKKSAKAYKLTDGAGLYLEVTPSGGKHWRYRFRLHGKESTFSLGEYPSVSLSEARKQREEARNLVKAGINPVQHRKVARLQRKHEAATTFAAVAEEWYSARSGKWSTGYAHHVKTIIEKDLNKFIGALPIKDIKTPAVYDAVRRIEKRQAPTRAILARQIIGSVFKLAILTHRAEYNVSDPIKGEIARRVVEHRMHLRQEPSLPDVPAVAETLPQFEATSWYGMFAPAGTPQDIIVQLNAEIARIITSPEMRERLARDGTETVGSTAEEFAAYFKASMAKWARVIKEANIKID